MTRPSLFEGIEMKNILPLFLSLTLLLASCVLVFAEAGPATIDMAGKSQPVVKFNHANHQGLDADCKTCHHMGVGNGTCKGCHGRDSRFADSQTAIHKSCNGCHETRGVATASNCDFCHVPAATTTPTTNWRDRSKRR
jgi:hypothetical protein